MTERPPRVPTTPPGAASPDPDDQPRFEAPRAAAIKTAKSKAKAKATLHGETRKHDQPVLILGGTGSFGSAIARELIDRAERVRLFVRDQGAALRTFGTYCPAEIVVGDAQDSEAVLRAAEGCRAIVQAVNYPLHQWEPHMNGVTANAIAAAKESGAPLLVPANVWVFGAQTEKPLTEKSEPAPNSRKGRLKLEIENTLKAATERDGVHTIILRAGDFFGPTVRNTYAEGIFARAARGKPITVVGRLDVAHQWAYLPDLARVAVWLIDRAHRLRPWEVIHFKGHIADPQRGFLRRIAEVAEHPGLKIRRVPWWKVRLASIVNRELREALELRYLYDSSVILDDRLLSRAWPDFTPTDLDDAIAITLAGYR